MIHDEEEKSFEYYSNIEPRKVEWLWYPYIPYGKITLLQGDPGEGKSTFIIQLISIITNGGILPDGNKIQDRQNVIYQCTEDSKEDTIRPRLISAGADCNRVLFIPDIDADLTISDSRIEKAIMESDARLFVFDPIQSFIPADVDMQNAVAMRSIMKSLANIAERNSCAILLVGHMNKSSSGKKLYRGLGSIDIAAIARSILMIARDEDCPENRYLFPIKSSLAPEGPAIGFSFSESNGFQWIGKSDFKVESEEKNLPIPSKKSKAKEYLIEVLDGEDLPSTVIMENMSKSAISQKTVRIAQKELGIISYRKENAWYWHLDKEEK